MRNHAISILLLALSLPMAAQAQFFHVNGATDAMTQFSTQAQAEGAYDCARGDTVWEFQGVSYNSATQRPEASFRQLQATVTLADGGSTPAPGPSPVPTNFLAGSSVAAVCGGSNSARRLNADTAGLRGWNCWERDPLRFFRSDR